MQANIFFFLITVPLVPLVSKSPGASHFCKNTLIPSCGQKYQTSLPQLAQLPQLPQLRFTFAGIGMLPKVPSQQNLCNAWDAPASTPLGVKAIAMSEAIVGARDLIFGSCWVDRFNLDWGFACGWDFSC